MWINYSILLFLLLNTGSTKTSKSRNKRYLLTPVNTQWGVFVTVSIPLHPDTSTTVAWFFEANYYTVSNSTYWYPLLGDVTISRSREKRSDQSIRDVLSRRLLYESLEAMLEKYGFPGRDCLLRSICSASSRHFHHNGLVGDLINLALTPTTSDEEEDLEDYYYEAEYLGLEDLCHLYIEKCPLDPLSYISLNIN